MRPRDLLSIFVHPWDLPKMFRTVAGPSMNFSQLSVWSQDFLLTFPALMAPSVSFPCIHGTIRPLFICQQAIPSNSINFMCFQGSIHQLLCIYGTFHQILSTLHAFATPFIEFSCGCRTFRQLPSTFRVSVGISVLLWVHPSTVCAEVGPSISIRQLSVCPRDLRSNF